eukprot:10040656-Karenia_brevis.AAC.1
MSSGLDNSMAKSSPFSAQEPHNSTHANPLSPSERGVVDGVPAPSDGVSPPPSPPLFSSFGGGDLAVQDCISPTMEFDIDDYQAKRARSITIPNGFQHCDL